MSSVLWDTVDAVLVSNARTLLGLPYVTEQTKFRGKVLATEPTVQFAKILIEDILDTLDALPLLDNKRPAKSSTCPEAKELPYPLYMMAGQQDSWRPLYTRAEVTACLSKIQRVAFNEPVNLFGLIEVRGVSAGYGIGSCNWVLQTDYEKITYISHSSIVYSHAMPFDAEPLTNSDVLLIGTISLHGNTRLEETVSDFCQKVVQTLREGGNVLVPCLPCGFLFDLIEALHGAMQVASGKLARACMYLVSSQAKSSLAYANIYGEWLNAQKEAQLYTADPPFVYDTLIKSGHLLPCPALHGDLNSKLRTPCVVFASHPSLRMGPIVHLLRTWGQNPLNALLLVDLDDFAPDFTRSGQSADVNHLLAPYTDLAMRVHQCPMDARVGESQLSQLITWCGAPRLAVVIPQECSHVSIVVDSSLHQFEAFALQSGSQWVLQFPARLETVVMDTRLADRLRPVRVGPDTELTLVEGRLVTHDGKHRLVPLTEDESRGGGIQAQSGSSGNTTGTSVEQRKPVLVGRIDPNRLVTELTQRGLTEARLETLEKNRRHIVYFPNSNTLIQLEPGKTHIAFEDERTRQIVRDSLLACLTQLSI